MEQKIIFQADKCKIKSSYEPTSKRTKLEICNKNEAKKTLFIISNDKRKGFRSTILNYIIKVADAETIKKLHRCSKYFFKKAPYLFIEYFDNYENFMKLGKEIIDRKEFKGKNSWVTKQLAFEGIVYQKHLFIKLKFVRCNSIRFSGGITTMEENFEMIKKLEKLKILTVTEKIKDKGKAIPLKTVASYLTNFEKINIGSCPITYQTLDQLELLPWKNNIKRLFLTFIDQVFQIGLFVEFLHKALAPKAEVLLYFNGFEDDEEGRRDFNEDINREIEMSWIPRKNRPSFRVMTEEDLINMETIEYAVIPL